MKVPWSSVFAVLKAVYVAFLRGRVVHLPGGIGDVTLPSQGHTIPLGLYSPRTVPVVTGYCPSRGPERQVHIVHPGTSTCTECKRDFSAPTVNDWAGVERRKPRPAPRPDGLPEPAPAPVPIAVSTLGVILFVVFGLPIVGLTMLGVTEWRTLADDVPGNHVTATLRAAWSRNGGAVFMATLVWFVFLAVIVVGVLAHAFFP